MTHHGFKSVIDHWHSGGNRETLWDTNTYLWKESQWLSGAKYAEQSIMLESRPTSYPSICPICLCCWELAREPSLRSSVPVFLGFAQLFEFIVIYMNWRYLIRWPDRFNWRGTSVATGMVGEETELWRNKRTIPCGSKSGYNRRRRYDSIVKISWEIFYS